MWGAFLPSFLLWVGKGWLSVWLARGREGGGSRSSQIELLELVEKSCLEGWVGRGVALGYSVSSLGVVRMLFAL